LVCGLVFHAYLFVVAGGPLHAGLARGHHGLEARFTANGDHARLMAVYR
jgi:hypothetical protein